MRRGSASNRPMKGSRRLVYAGAGGRSCDQPDGKRRSANFEVRRKFRRQQASCNTDGGFLLICVMLLCWVVVFRTPSGVRNPAPFGRCGRPIGLAAPCRHRLVVCVGRAQRQRGAACRRHMLHSREKRKTWAGDGEQSRRDSDRRVAQAARESGRRGGREPRRRYRADDPPPEGEGEVLCLPCPFPACSSTPTPVR